MKILSLLTAGFVALATMAFSPATTVNTGDPVSKSVDLKNSEVVWKGYKVLGSHTGTIGLKSGNLQFTDGVLTGGQFEIDMNSIVCTDLEGGTADKLVGHLKSDDFFGVATYPTAKFVITNAYPYGKNQYKVTGNLTIKETTQSIKFIADVSENDGVMMASADIEVDRSEYDVRYGSGTLVGNLGDNTIYDEFEMQVKIATQK